MAIERGRPGARMFRQPSDLRALPAPILVLEGPPTPLDTRLEQQALGVHFWCIRQGISPLFTSGPRSTATAVFQMARKPGREWGEPGAATGEPPDHAAVEGGIPGETQLGGGAPVKTLPT